MALEMQTLHCSIWNTPNCPKGFNYSKGHAIRAEGLAHPRFLLLLLFIYLFFSFVNLPKQVSSISLAISSINSLFLSRCKPATHMNSKFKFVIFYQSCKTTINKTIKINYYLRIINNNNNRKMTLKQ